MKPSWYVRNATNEILAEVKAYDDGNDRAVTPEETEQAAEVMSAAPILAELLDEIWERGEKMVDWDVNALNRWRDRTRLALAGVRPKPYSHDMEINVEGQAEPLRLHTTQAATGEAEIDAA